MPRYAELIYNGFWFSPEREMLQARDRQEPGERRRHGSRLKLYKGGVHVIGRESPYSLYDQDLVTFEEGAGRLRPARRGGLHQAQRAAAADAGAAAADDGALNREWDAGWRRP